MSGPGDIGGEVSGDEAAWRDLIARFDVPADRTSSGAPWPASEDLPDAAVGSAEHGDGPPRPGGDAPERGGALGEHDRSPQGGGLGEHDSSLAQRGGLAEPDGSRAQRDGLAKPDGNPAQRDGLGEHGGSYAQDGGIRPDHGRGPAEHGSGPAATLPESQLDADQARRLERPANPAASFAFPSDRTRVIRPAGDPRNYTPAEEQDEPYVPVPLPPPAKMDSVTKAALVGVVGGPGYLLVVSVFLHWAISAEVALIAVAAFVAGFVTLVLRLGDRSSRDDDDDGAVL
jgi:hypothetical protein